MTIAAGSFRTVVAMVTASGVLLAPLVISQAAERVTSRATYRLAAVSSGVTGASVTNIPVNLFNLIISMPASEVAAMNRLADAMIATGSWQVWGPTNVFGFDEQDPAKLAAVVDMLIPIPPLSSVIGDQLGWWARANFPMNAGCAAQPSACPDVSALVNASLKVPAAQLYDGYQFPQVTNPFTDEPTSWSGQYVKLDRGAAVTAVTEYLTGPPTGVQTVTVADTVSTTAKLGNSIYDAFYPFVQNSEWFDDRRTAFSPVFRALAPALCPTCTPGRPYGNPWLENYSPDVRSAASVITEPGADAATSVVDPDRSSVGRAAAADDSEHSSLAASRPGPRAKPRSTSADPARSAGERSAESGGLSQRRVASGSDR